MFLEYLLTFFLVNTDLKVTTDQKKPCESCHTVTLSSEKPKNIVKPLILSLPYPVLVSEIPNSVQIKEGLVDLVLRKALFEPWPQEFETLDSLKWVAGSLKPWEESKDWKNTLKVHLSSSSLCPAYSSVLNERRIFIKTFFESATELSVNCVIIQLNGSTSPDWSIQLHKPVLTSPLGAPMLLLAAYDHRLAEILEREGKWRKREIDEDFLAKREAKILVDSLEESLLLRYVLRLNSTKFVPNEWQKKNLPLGENSPWLATFISPLYLDFPMNRQVIEQLNAKLDSTSQMGLVNCCAVCKKFSPSIKRCGRCKNILYCSAECQLADRPQHKSSCIRK